uniref:Putative ovule protein n=1 Tax=Solanum chacoense TaxID=4108 RepID=A0A0V0GYU3_SOLCH
MLNVCPHHMQTNEVLAHTFFEGLDYNAHALLNSAAGGHALSRTTEEFFDLLDKLSEGNQGYEGEMSRTTTQKAAGIFDVDQATAINVKLDAMQHNMALHFKQMALNQAPVNVVQQAAN